MATATKARKSYDPVRSGADPRKDAEGGQQQWLKIEPNSFVDGAVLVEADEILSCEQCAIWLEEGNSPVWVYTGPEDPSHDLRLDRRYRAFLPILVDGEVKVWSMGKGAHGQLLDVADATGSIKGMEFRIKRTGAGLATRYSIVSKAKRRDVSKIDEVDVLALLGPITADEVKEMIAQKLELPDYEAVLEKYSGKLGKAAGKSKVKDGKSPAKVKGRHVMPDEDLEDELDLEDEEDLEEVELV